MPERDPDRAPIELDQVDAVNNLDTARMSLRWALERLRSLQKERDAQTLRADSEQTSREKVDKENANLKRTIALTAEESAQREVYYRKMEDLINLKLSGKLEVASLLNRELEAARLQEYIVARQAELDKDYAAKRDATEAEYQQLKAELEKSARARELKAEEYLERRRESLDKELAPKLVQFHETEIRLRNQEKILKERQDRFEQFYISQRSQMDQENKLFREEIEDQVRFRLEGTQHLMADRHAFKERAWEDQKAVLLKELEDWQKKFRSQTEKFIELERQVADSEDAAKSSHAALSHEAGLHDAQTLEFHDLQAKSAAQVHRTLELEKALADEKARAEKAELAALHESEQRHTVEAELTQRLAEAQRAGKDRHARIIDLESRFKTADEAAFRADHCASAEKSEKLRLEAALREQLELAQKKNEDNFTRITELAKSLAEAGHKIQLADEAAFRADHCAAAETDEKMRLEKLLSEQSELWQEKNRTLFARTKELERALAESEEGRQHGELMDTVRAELLSWQQKSRDQFGRILELETRLAQADDISKRERLSSSFEDAQLKVENQSQAQDLAKAKKVAEEQQAQIFALGQKLSETEEARARERHDAAVNAEHLRTKDESQAHDIASLEMILKEKSELWQNKKKELRAKIEDFEKRLSEVPEEHLLGALREEILIWQEKSKAQFDRNLALEKQLARAEEAAKREALAAGYEKEQRLMDESLSTTNLTACKSKIDEQSEKIRLLEARLMAANEKTSDIDSLETLLGERRLRLRESEAAFKEKLHQAEVDFTGKEERLKTAVRDFESEKRLLSEKFEQAKSISETQLSRNLELEKEAALARQAEAEARGKAANTEAMVKAREQIWLKEKERLFEQLKTYEQPEEARREAVKAELEEELADEKAELVKKAGHWRQRCEEREAECAAIERRLEENEAIARKTNESLNESSERERQLDELRRSLEAQRQDIEKRSQELEASLKQQEEWQAQQTEYDYRLRQREEAAARREAEFSAKAGELDAQLQAAKKRNLDAAHAEDIIEEQRRRKDELAAEFADEKARLMAKADDWRQRYDESEAMLTGMRSRLAASEEAAHSAEASTRRSADLQTQLKDLQRSLGDQREELESRCRGLEASLKQQEEWQSQQTAYGESLRQREEAVARQEAELSAKAADLETQSRAPLEREAPLESLSDDEPPPPKKD